MHIITPILLAGGSGSRLWPLSRKTYPKQFTKLTSNETLFQQSALRLNNSNLVKFNSHITITNYEFRFIVKEQLDDVGVESGTILIEPEGKNTAPAILAATILAYKENKDAIMISMPSDHIIPDNKYFNDAIMTGLKGVEDGKIVTFGINPTRPETGYGYLKVEKSHINPKSVMSFVEKPDEDLATKMLKEGNYLWNSGIFLFRAKDMITAFNSFEKEMLSLVQKSLDMSEVDLGFTKLDNYFWSKLEEISIDYAIMEKTSDLVAVLFSADWSDLGNWDAVWHETKQDQDGVALSKNAHAIECKNTLLRSEKKTQQIVGLGLNNIVAVAMPDAVLVANRKKSQDVKNIVKYLKLNNVSQSEDFLKVHRPWGWFESLSLGRGFQVKRLFLKPGAALSLQKHKYRSEHWVVVRGTAKVTIDKDIKLAKEGQSLYVPKESLHRLENPNETPVIIIEVQIGNYLGEDDIVRYDDIYDRE